MRKFIIILTAVMTILGPISPNLVMAINENSDIESRLNIKNVSLSVTMLEIKGMDKFLEEMANAIRSGNSSQEVETNSAIILTHLSDILDAMANPDDGVAYLIKTQQNIEVEKEWNPWNEMVEH